MVLKTSILKSVHKSLFSVAGIFVFAAAVDHADAAASCGDQIIHCFVCCRYIVDTDVCGVVVFRVFAAHNGRADSVDGGEQFDRRNRTQPDDAAEISI